MAVLLLVCSLNAFGQNNKRKSGVTHEETWISKRKNKSSARTTKRPIRRPNGICTGCCDPCYNDDVGNWRKHSKWKSKVTAIHRKRSKTK